MTVLQGGRLSLIAIVLALITFTPLKVAGILAAVAAPMAPPATYESLEQQAEASYAEKSFSRAHAAYEEAAKLELEPEQRRWVEFRLADTLWRSNANDLSV